MSWKSLWILQFIIFGLFSDLIYLIACKVDKEMPLFKIMIIFIMWDRQIPELKWKSLAELIGILMFFL